MKHQLSTIAVLALIAVPVSACGSTTDAATEEQVTVVDQAEDRLYESDIVGLARAAHDNRLYESDIVSRAGAAR